MRLELAVAKRERDFYLQKVDQAKQIEKMAARRAAEAAGASKNDVRLEGPPLDAEETPDARRRREAREEKAKRDERAFMLRRFTQRASIGSGVDVDDTRGMMDVDVLRDLFAGSATTARLGGGGEKVEKVRLLPIRPRSRGARRSLRTFPVVALHPFASLSTIV
jgi:hypothetical protein